MILLSIRTDNPEAELGLFDGGTELNYIKWHAHRQLAETIHKNIEELLSNSGVSLQDIKGVICYKGPGSFTGLRIGLSVANALSSGLGVPIMGATGNNWLQEAKAAIISGKNEVQVLPEYGSPVHITKQKK